MNEKKINVRFIWNGEDPATLEKMYEVMESMLNDPELDLTRELFAEAFIEQLFSKS